MQLTPGSRLGPYEVLSPLGKGGMGEVYRARDPRLGRDVALKIVAAGGEGQADRFRRFEQEARAVAALNHPHVLAVHDVGSESGVAYVIFELLEGQTLRERLAHGPIALRKTVEYGVQIGRGLAAAHARGLLHRDLKPENLFLTSDGLIKILDFGLAKLSEPRDGDVEAAVTRTATYAGLVVGTAGYMSPEQARGARADARSDVFALGAVLYEMLSGRPAFAGDTAADRLSAILNHDPLELGSASGEPVSPGLERIVRRCLEKDPEERFQTARDVAFALEAIGAATSGRIAAATRLPAKRVRFRWLATGLTTAGLLAVAFWTARQMAVRPVPSFQRITFRRGAVESARFAPDGRTVIYAAAWDGDPLRIFSTRTERPESSRLEVPDADLEAVSTGGEMLIALGVHLDYSSESTLARVPLAGGAPRAVAEHVVGADWGPEGAMALVRHVDDRYRLEYPAGQVVYQSADWVSRPRVSPDGDRVAFFLAYEGAMALGVVDRSGVVRILSKGWKWGGESMFWSRRGDEIWFAASERGWVHPLRAITLSGRERVVLRLPGWVIPQDVSAEGRVLLSFGPVRSRIQCLAPGEIRERELSWFESSLVNDLSPDGKTMLFSEVGAAAGSKMEAEAYLRRTDGSPPVRLGDGLGRLLSPDGRFAYAEANVQGGWLLPTGPGELRPLAMDGLEAVGWYPDSQRLLLTNQQMSAKSRCYSLDIVGGKPQPVTIEGVRCLRSPSPSGKELLVESAEGKGRLYSLLSGVSRPIAGFTASDQPLSWGADGRSLFVQREPLPAAKIDRLDLGTRQRQLVREIVLGDPAGLVRSQSGVKMAPNGAYCYSYMQNQWDLYQFDGLR